MKKLLLLMLVLFLAGCGVSEKVYTTGKVIYRGARVAYIELPVQSDSLEKVDKVVVTYDKVRTEVKTAIAETKKKQVANTLSVQEN